VGYDLIAIDLDGTLLDSEQRLAERNRRALHAAHAAGLKIVICTGRSFPETRPILREIGLDMDASVTAGGALISDPDSGDTLESIEMTSELARELIDWFSRRDYVVLVLHDGSRADFDGVAIDAAIRHPAVVRWLNETPIRMRAVASGTSLEHAPLRISIVDDTDKLRELERPFRQHFSSRAAHNVIRVPAFDFTVIEAFAPSVSKWDAIRRLCRRWRIDPRRTIAIGDDVNDLPMLEHAGLGVAMANAGDAVRDGAGRVTRSNDECGVAELLEELCGSTS